MALLDVALACVGRGWHVFPCWPRTKKPMTRNGWKDASNDAEKIREWWTRTPDANVAIACNPSGLCVLDIDHGLIDWTANHALWEHTYTVRTGRRPEFGVQMYFAGQMPDVGLWKLNGCEGQVKSAGGYVMAAGGVHPDSGETYAVLFDGEALAIPEWVRSLKSERQAVKEDGPITANRNVTLTSIAGKLRNAGLSHAALEVSLLQVNADRCVPPLEEEEVKKIAEHIASYPLPEPDPVATNRTHRNARTRGRNSC